MPRVNGWWWAGAAKDSPATAVLQRLKEDKPLLQWAKSTRANGAQILSQIHQNKLPLTLINADVYHYYRYLHPETKTAFSLARRWPARWWLRQDKDDSLAALINAFIGRYKNSSEMAALRRVYFDHLGAFDYLDNVYYLRRMREILPRYAGLFREAAIGYQESH